MLKSLLEKKEKKVEYVELIYDLIFVYIIGRNNALMHNIENGFVSWGTFLNYAVGTLAVIQIWNFTTYYINAYGRNSVRDHVFQFINMFLLYFVGEGIRSDWGDYHTQYHVAWALILVNIGVQYLIEMRHHKNEKWHTQRFVRMTATLFIEAAIVGFSVAEYQLWHTSFASFAAIVFGVASVFLTGKKSCPELIDFEHLTERAMLYVVFTFGEMIIAIAGYFEGDFSLNSLYFALMGFLIVVALFLSYEVIYDHIVDRKMQTNGLGYMFIHIFIIFSLNNITTALEFMREEEVSLFPKMLFLTASMLLYFAFLFSTVFYAKKKCHFKRSFYWLMGGAAVLFTALMLLFREWMAVNIAVTVAYVFGVFFYIYHSGKKLEASGSESSEK